MNITNQNLSSLSYKYYILPPSQTPKAPLLLSSYFGNSAFCLYMIKAQECNGNN